MRRFLGKKTWVSVGAILMSASVILSGCKSKGAAEAGQPKEKPEITVGVYDRGSVPAAEGTIEDNRWTRWINENAPVKVKFVPIPRSGAAEKLNTLFASGTAPDLITLFEKDYLNSLITQKQVIALDELIETHSIYYKEVLAQYPVLRKMGMGTDGHLYKIGKVNGLDINGLLFIRGDWLKKLNLELPKTSEELFAVAKAFTEQDPDGNGANDTYGLALSSSGGGIDYMFQNVTRILKNGELVRDWERAKAATEFKKRLFDAGIVDRDYLTDAGGKKAKQDWMKGKLGIWSSQLKLDEYRDFKANNPDGEIMILPLPSGPFGQFGPEANSPYAVNAVINRNAKNPEAVMQYVDWIMDPANSRIVRYGFEGEHWAKGGNGCPTPIDQEKTKSEVSWASDFIILASRYAEGICGTVAGQLDLNDKAQKAFAALYEEARAANLSKDKPMPYPIDSSSAPVLPQDLLLIDTNASQAVSDLWVKAIVSRDGYSVDQAMTDAKGIWQKSGGQKVDDWFKDYYAKYKDTLVHTSSWYDGME